MAQADSTIAAVAFDSDGRIVKVYLDTAQSKISFNRDWTISTDTTAPGQTKKELGDARYEKGFRHRQGMVRADCRI